MPRSYKTCDAKCKRSLKTSDSAWCFCKRVILFFHAMWSMIGGNEVNGSVCKTFDDLLAVLCGAKWRIHFGQRSVSQKCLISQSKMMRCCFSMNIRPHFLCHAATPYTTNKKGHGPAWSNSLFEDAAEFGYGMLLAQRAIRDRLKNELDEIAANTDKADVKDAIKEWNDTFASGIENGPATEKLVAALEACGCDASKNVLKEKDFLAKKSQWIFGGDGWAYDIGFGGVDHVLASGKDINVMVFDTEVYSNTGGQSSKATPTGAIAQFAAGGKETKKKDLAGIAMSYGYVYVAHISMGADMNQCVKALAEAEAYPGPSLIIAYAPCINHGIKKGMDKAMTEEKLALECGYWNNFRYNPAAEKKFTLDSKAPKMEGYQDFLKGEVRYLSLTMKNPDRAATLFARNEKEAKERYEHLSKLVALYGND